MQERGAIMSKNIFRIIKISVLLGMLITLLAFPFHHYGQEDQIKRAKIYDDIYPLLSEVDLYCSIMIWDEKKPKIKIIGAEREYEKEIMSDGDVVYINKGKEDGLEQGQLFIILEIEINVPGFGPVAYKRGRLRVMDLAANRASAVIEKSCGWVRIGNYLIPFEPKETVMGKDLGYDISPFEASGAKGEVIYLQTDFNQIGSGHWALIDLGAEDGIQLGQQMILYRELEKDAPLQIFGNVVIVDIQNKTSTIKVLSCRDAVRIGDLIMARPNH
jgi:hypothetical protein